MDIFLHLDRETERDLWAALEQMNDGLAALNRHDQQMTMEQYVNWLIRDAMAQRRLREQSKEQ